MTLLGRHRSAQSLSADLLERRIAALNMLNAQHATPEIQQARALAQFVDPQVVAEAPDLISAGKTYLAQRGQLREALLTAPHPEAPSSFRRNRTSGK